MTETAHSRGLELRPEMIVNPGLFWSKVRRLGPSDCWEWQTANRFRCGYGKHSIKRDGQNKEAAAHRIAFVLNRGERLPAGAHVLHSCDNRLCCNPAHLRVGTRSDNRRDAVARGRWKRRELRGGNSASAKKVFADGIIYPSAVDAAEALGMNYFTVAARARIGRFGYRYVD